MKRNVSGIVAVALAVAISSFTVKKKFVNVYLIFDPFASIEKDLSNYTLDVASPGTFMNSSPRKLAWFRMVDNDGEVSPEEFASGFEALDVTSSAINKLSDEPTSSEGPNLEFR